jgi:hypothetical protein
MLADAWTGASVARSALRIGTQRLKAVRIARCNGTQCRVLGGLWLVIESPCTPRSTPIRAPIRRVAVQSQRRWRAKDAHIEVPVQAVVCLNGTVGLNAWKFMAHDGCMSQS